MTPTPAVRPAAPTDRETIRQLAVSNAMFTAEEFEEVLAIFDEAMQSDSDEHRWSVAVAADGSVVGAAYCSPEPFADRLWNLYFLAAAPQAHGSGAGTALINSVEAGLRADGEDRARVLIVETSSTAPYAGARDFYRARGFTEEATVREYYGPGDHKVIFWKSLV